MGKRSKKGKERRKEQRKEVGKPRRASTGEVLRRIEGEKRRKKIFYASLLILVAIVATAWYMTSRSTPVPTPTGTLVVHTIDEFTGEPLSGMTIGIFSFEYETTVQSNEKGEYRFGSIPAVQYAVAAWSETYHTVIGSMEYPLVVDVKAGETIHRTIRLHTHNQTS